MNWISVDDGLPKALRDVVIVRRGNLLGFGYKETDDPQSKLWMDRTKRDRDGDWLYVFDVTHWYPIPEIPTKED